MVCKCSRVFFTSLQSAQCQRGEKTIEDDDARLNPIFNFLPPDSLLFRPSSKSERIPVGFVFTKDSQRDGVVMVGFRLPAAF